MSAELVIVLVLLAAAIVMFAINKPRMDAVALIMLVGLPFTGVLTMGEALAGFSDQHRSHRSSFCHWRRPGSNGRRSDARRLADRESGQK